MRRYGVVIVTYNRLELLKKCLRQVLSQSNPVTDVIIVDNASNDGTVEYLKELRAPKDGIAYTIIYNEYNKGGAGGYADGIREAAAKQNLDYVLLIDDDALIDKDYILNIDNAVNEHPQIKAFSGSVKVNGRIDTSHRRRVKSRLMAAFSEVSEAEYAEGKSFFYDQTSFCGVVIAHDLMKLIGFPISDYFIRYDDTEYSFRIRKHTRILNVNNAFIDHRVKMAYGRQQIDSKLYYDVRNRIDMARRHLGHGAVFILYIRAAVKIFLCQLLNLLYVIAGKKDRAESCKQERRYYIEAVRDGRSHRLGKRESFDV